jgi:hypothetical protein
MGITACVDADASSSYSFTTLLLCSSVREPCNLITTTCRNGERSLSSAPIGPGGEAEDGDGGVPPAMAPHGCGANRAWMPGEQTCALRRTGPPTAPTEPAAGSAGGGGPHRPRSRRPRPVPRVGRWPRARPSRRGQSGPRRRSCGRGGPAGVRGWEAPPPGGAEVGAAGAGALRVAVRERAGDGNGFRKARPRGPAARFPTHDDGDTPPSVPPKARRAGL